MKHYPWPTWIGFIFFIGMMAVGYYYNLTFIQFGLLDLGVRVLGMSRQAVAVNMAYLALFTCLIAISVGLLMMRTGWSSQFITKLRMAFGVVVVQTALTAAAPFVASQQAFFVWIVVASCALGVGVPATFSLTVDLIPTRMRGYAAAAVTAVAYFMAAVFSSRWTIERFSLQMLVVMLPGLAALGALAFVRFPFMQTLASQHEKPEFYRGRFVRLDPDGQPHLKRRLVVLIVLMFGIFFIDSLGFIRLSETPVYFETAWQSADLTPRLLIALVHVMGALVGGVLYTALNEKSLFLWIFGIFALVHLMYSFHARIVPTEQAALSMPLLYALAVSLYTVVNFAIWADVSIPRTVSRNSALGVALSGWTATFLSTALALQWEQSGMPLLDHLNLVDGLAMIFFLVVLGLIYFPSTGHVRERQRQ